MRNLVFVCASVTLVSGIVSVNLWRELHAERQLTATLRQQLDESQATMAAPTADRMQVMPQSVPGMSVPVVLPPDGKSEAPAAARDSDRPVAQNADINRIIFNQQEMMKDPEYRKARLAQTRMSLPQNYPGLVEELGLTPEEADRLFDLLAENQLEMSDVSMLSATINGVQPDPAVAEDANRRRMEMQRRQDESLMVMLGGARYSQWQDYQQTRGARQQVMQLGRTLESVGVPLSPEQSRPLTAAYVAEQKRQRDESQRMFASAQQAGTMDQARMIEESSRLQAESNRRIVEAAKPHLNSQQLEALQASLDQQLVMTRATSRMLRQQVEAQGQNPAPVISIFTTAAPVPVP